MKYLKLRNGDTIPSIGFGTYGLSDDYRSLDILLYAMEVGNRLFDTASKYGTERVLGRAVRESGIGRDKLFIQSKMWLDERGYDNTLRAFERSLEALGLDYLDGYMIHWPATGNQYSDPERINRETWRAILELHQQGLIRVPGVCNFRVSDFETLPQCLPYLNQIEYHPGWRQEEISDYCAQNDILIQAWTPLGRGRILSDPAVIRIAGECDRTPAQIVLRWEEQRGLIPLPRSTNEGRISQNIDIFDFSLTEEQMQALDNIPEGTAASMLDPSTYNGTQSSAQNR